MENEKRKCGWERLPFEPVLRYNSHRERAKESLKELPRAAISIIKSTSIRKLSRKHPPHLHMQMLWHSSKVQSNKETPPLPSLLEESGAS